MIDMIIDSVELSKNGEAVQIHGITDSEKIEFITEITTTEEADTLLFSADSNGNPLNLLKFVCVFKTKNGNTYFNTTGSGNIFVQTDSRIGWNYVIGAFSSATKHGVIGADCRSGVLETMGIVLGSYNDNPSDIYNISSIKNILLRPSVGKLTDGINIKLYGIRA